MQELIHLPAGSVLNVTAHGPVVASQLQNATITASLVDGSAQSFGPYMIGRDFLISGNATAVVVDVTSNMLPGALVGFRDIPWDVELQFTRNSYLIDGAPVQIVNVFADTADFSGDTNPVANPDVNGMATAWVEAIGTLKPKFARAGGFLLQAETNFTAYAAFSIQAAHSADWSDGVSLLQAEPDGLTLTQPSAATVLDGYATGYRSRVAWLCTPTVSAASINGSAPISLAGEATDFSFVGLTIKSNLQFLRMAQAAGITAEQLILLSS